MGDVQQSGEGCDEIEVYVLNKIVLVLKRFFLKKLIQSSYLTGLLLCRSRMLHYDRVYKSCQVEQLQRSHKHLSKFTFSKFNVNNL